MTSEAIKYFEVNTNGNKTSQILWDTDTAVLTENTAMSFSKCALSIFSTAHQFILTLCLLQKYYCLLN